MKRRALLLAAALASRAEAQADWRRNAVPYVAPQAWLRSLDELWYAPRAAEFAQATTQLVSTLEANCSPAAARRRWRDAMLAWERLAAVQTGALIERKSARAIDFTPTRPAAIGRAMAQPALGLASIGAPALGLPALEWLLWRAPAREAAATWAYTRRVATHLAAEADALAAAYATARKRDEEATQRDFATLINQLVGGVATLRWAQMGKPRREGQGQWPRATSGATHDAWQARAQALRSLLEHSPAARAPVALEPFLRGRGLNALADRLRAASAHMGAAVAAATPHRAAAAERALGALETVLGNEVAPKLDVAIGFSDADGD